MQRILAATAVTLALVSGCALIGSRSESVTTTANPVYPAAVTYPDIDVVDDIVYGDADGTPLLLDICLPNDDDGVDDGGLRPAVVSIHGGSWARGDKADLNWRSVCQWLASEGFVAASVNYRLAPAATFPAAIDDVQRAVRFLREPEQVQRFGLDPARIGAFGGSAGGNLAALLGVSGEGALDSGDRVAAVAELSGPADLTSRGARTVDFEPAMLAYLGCASLDRCPQAVDASPVRHVDATDPPFLVAHSVTERIPIAQSDEFVAELRGEGVDVTYLTVEGAAHSIAMLDDALRTRIADFLREHL